MDTTWHGDEAFLKAEGHKAKAIHRDGWIWGLGANNMKSGLASALVVVEAIAKEKLKLKGDLLYAGVVGEIEKAPVDQFQGHWLDGYGVGTRHMVTHGITADYAILCEPTGLRVCTANLGAIWAKITVAGTLSHSARARGGGAVNAIEEMHDLHSDLRRWIADYEAAHAYLGEHPNVTVSAIQGGMPWRASANPIECHIYLDIRIVPGTSIEDVRRSLRESLRSFARQRGSPEPALEFYVSSPATVIPNDALIVDVISAAHKRVTSKDPATFIRRAGADASHMNAYGVPCIIYGPGGRNHPEVKNMDSSGEHASVENLVAAGRVYLDTALTMCNAIAARPRHGI
jgi:acetylornithine deacetylase/succinyl-diaminopimelate desuccinylase-like protein